MISEEIKQYWFSSYLLCRLWSFTVLRVFQRIYVKTRYTRRNGNNTFVSFAWRALFQEYYFQNAITRFDCGFALSFIWCCRKSGKLFSLNLFIWYCNIQIYCELLWHSSLRSLQWKWIKWWIYTTLCVQCAFVSLE